MSRRHHIVKYMRYLLLKFLNFRGCLNELVTFIAYLLEYVCIYECVCACVCVCVCVCVVLSVVERVIYVVLFSINGVWFVCLFVVLCCCFFGGGGWLLNVTTFSPLSQTI